MTDKTVNATGSWTDPSDWSKGVPKGGSAVQVSSGDTVKLDNTVAKGASLDVEGTLVGTGTLKASSVTGGGTIEASGGTLDVKGDVLGTSGTPSFLIDANSTLEFDKSVPSSATVTFEGASAALDLTNDGQAAFKGTVAGFAIGDQIDVKGAKGDTVSFDGTALTILDKNGVVQETIKLDGTPGEQFNLATIHGVDVITMQAPTCFMAGTLIRTPEGEIPVEKLERGDLVITADGVAKPVIWLGRQTISTVFADPRRAWPIRIKAGAIDDNVPARDLVVSPGHAIYIDGALILASSLVNGTSVVREAVVPKVFTYYHIELDEHSLLLAENTPAESFVDNVERLAFDNWAEHEAFYPHGKPIIELPYPVAKSKRQVPVDIRVKLGERAHKICAIAAAVA